MVPQDPTQPLLSACWGVIVTPSGFPITGAQKGGGRERGSNDPPPPPAQANFPPALLQNCWTAILRGPKLVRGAAMHFTDCPMVRGPASPSACPPLGGPPCAIAAFGPKGVQGARSGSRRPQPGPDALQGRQNGPARSALRPRGSTPDIQQEPDSNPLCDPHQYGLLVPPPPPPAQTRARFWFQDQECGNTGSPCLDKPVLARGTYCGTQVAGIAQPIVHDYERVSNRPAYTPEYKSTWNYSCSNTLSPILTLPASCTKL